MGEALDFGPVILSMRYAVAVLIDAFAAATVVVWVCLNFMKSLIW